jgi:hypothetical protein
MICIRQTVFCGSSKRNLANFRGTSMRRIWVLLAVLVCGEGPATAQDGAQETRD